eukprot:11111779-Alexandrium_andersonii.AAC.1
MELKKAQSSRRAPKPQPAAAAGSPGDDDDMFGEADLATPFADDKLARKASVPRARLLPCNEYAFPAAALDHAFVHAFFWVTVVRRGA